MDDRLERVEQEVRDVRTTLVILDERQQRMHDDFKTLTDALTENTRAISQINALISNRKGFIAGVVTVITLLGGILATLLGSITRWFQ